MNTTFFKIWWNMKFRNIFLMTVVASGVTIAAFCPKPAPADKEVALLQSLMTALNQLHFSPQMMDDAFSQKVYKLYLDRIDAGRRFYTQADVEQLKPYESQLDDQIKAFDYTFFNKSEQLLNASMTKVEGFYKEVIEMPINFSGNENETIEMDGDKKPYAKNDAELKDMWRKMIKYEVMTRLANKLEDKEKGKADTKDKSEEELKKAALTETTKQYNDYFKRLKKLKRMDRLSTYLNSIANVFDPHTEYFEPVEKQNFDIGMSGRLIGIGARLQTDLETDFTKITDIMIGGPAHKQGELKEGDIIMKVAQGDKEPVDISGMDINEVVSMIRGKEKTEVRLTVKAKADGKMKVIPIIREEVIVDEGFAKSLIIQENNNSDKIGYIKLPKFYADFENDNGHQCAEDVAVEVDKLKKAGVKGIVIDLRNNGGGSLRDVVKMSGLFIEQGPIVQVKARNDRPDVLNDTDPSVQYGGPLVIMVNEFSASASEIMAAALQDYGRAIIVGTPTYGKGTVQRFFDLDRAYGRSGSTANGEPITNLGNVKVTIQKFFRVNGGSTQLKGVTPDIILPDNYMEVPVGEKDNEHPMPWTSINPVKYGQSVVDLKNIPLIKSNSEKRIKNNPTFAAIVNNAKRMKAQRDNTEYPLNMTAFKAYEAKQEALVDAYKKAIKPIDGFLADNLAEDFAAIKTSNDSSKIIRNTEWLKDVKKDVQLYETLLIMKDMVQNATFKTAAVMPKRD
ncbi:MAG: carboxy terminal-processing peptidase [Saprospiraceae bacterium]|nr:carboxy terminal-processing peptidase [Saprospiraceae bacterium]